MFLLEPHLHADGLEVAHGFQKVDRVPCESADGLGEYDVDFPGSTVGEHSFELVPLVGEGTRYSAVNIHACVFPFGIFLYQFAVVADLCGCGMQKPLGVLRNAGIRSDFFPCRKGCLFWLYFGDFPHKINSFPTLYITLKASYIKGFPDNNVDKVGRYFSRSFVLIWWYSSSEMDPFLRSVSAI